MKNAEGIPSDQPPQPPASAPYLGFSVWRIPLYAVSIVRILAIFSTRLWRR